MFITNVGSKPALADKNNGFQLLWTEPELGLIFGIETGIKSRIYFLKELDPELDSQFYLGLWNSNQIGDF
jgi:hypothetical protein